MYACMYVCMQYVFSSCIYSRNLVQNMVLHICIQVAVALLNSRLSKYQKCSCRRDSILRFFLSSMYVLYITSIVYKCHEKYIPYIHKQFAAAAGSLLASSILLVPGEVLKTKLQTGVVIKMKLKLLHMYIAYSTSYF